MKLARPVGLTGAAEPLPFPLPEAEGARVLPFPFPADRALAGRLLPFPLVGAGVGKIGTQPMSDPFPLVRSSRVSFFFSKEEERTAKHMGEEVKRNAIPRARDFELNTMFAFESRVDRFRSSLRFQFFSLENYETVCTERCCERSEL